MDGTASCSQLLEGCAPAAVRSIRDGIMPGAATIPPNLGGGFRVCHQWRPTSHMVLLRSGTTHWPLLRRPK